MGFVKLWGGGGAIPRLLFVTQSLAKDQVLIKERRHTIRAGRFFWVHALEFCGLLQP